MPEEAEIYSRRALALKEKLLGAEHPDVAVTLNNLGLLLKKQGKLSEAAERYERALAIFEAQLSSDHLKLLTTRANLAKLRPKLAAILFSK